MAETTPKSQGGEVDFFLQERADMVRLKINPNESVSDFRHRVAGALRGSGHIIEAHEALSGKLYDDPDQGPTGPMTGIFGAVFQTMQGKSYSTDPEQKVGDDIAAGVLAQRGEDPTRSALASIFSLLGPEAGIDLINGMTEKNAKPVQI